MKWRDLLVWGVRLYAMTGILAIVPAIAPASWLTTAATKFGLTLGSGPLDGYLSRHLSLMYFTIGAWLLVISLDIDRYLPLLRGCVYILLTLGVLQLAIDAAVGMPLWWTALEGPRTLLSGAILGWLIQRLGKSHGT